MARDTLLAGCSVLVLEDDFFLADDLKQSLEDAGASVLGPYGRVGDALRLIDQTRPDCAIVDVNLGNGPSFEMARALKARAIPFVLATGYDASVIPQEFADMPCLEKPVDLRKLVAAVLELRGEPKI